MSLIKANWHPDRKELRVFAVIALIACALIALVFFLLHVVGKTFALVILGIGAAIFLADLISAALSLIFYRVLMAIALPMGLVVSFTLLTVFYILLITPMALLFRVMGRDPLQRKFEADAGSYWVPRRPPDSVGRYFRQF
jgi:hypothetical protein